MDVLAIYNLALSMCGGRKLLASTSDDSPEADVCNLWYEISRDWVFAQAYWPEAISSEQLTLLTERDETEEWTWEDPPPPWKYAYIPPGAYRKIRHVMSAEPGGQTKYWDFKLGEVLFDDQRVIATNCPPPAVATFTRLRLDPFDWGPNLQKAVVFALAGNLALPLSLKPEFRAQMIREAQMFIGQAILHAANENQQRLPEFPSDTVEARGGYPLPRPQDARD